MESLENYDMASLDNALNNTNFLKTIFENYPDGFVFKDKDLKYVFANKQFCDFFGITSSEKFLGRTNFPYFSEDNQRLIYDAGKTVATSLKSLNYILNVKNVNGDDILFSVTTSPIFLKKQFFGVVSLVKDITSEEILKEKFVLKHFQLKKLIENLPLLIYMQDKAGNYIIGTEFARRFVKDSYDEFSSIQLNAKSNIEQSFKENDYVLKNNKTLNVIRKILDVNMLPHWYKICKVPITDYKNETTGVLTIAENIDIEKGLEAQKETYVATLGHDLKNPTIAQIRGLELLLKGDFGEVSVEQREILEMVLDSCKYMNGMLASLLATYRNNSGAIKLIFEDFSFVSLINECVNEMEFVARNKDVGIAIKKMIDFDDVNADKVQIKRVIMNLLSNGIKYAFKNTIVELRVSLDEGMLLFELENESPFIPEDEQSAIFERYVSYASTLKELGNGLGLYASQKIINSHDGEMFVKSFRDNKNIFGFRIPLKPKMNIVKDIQF